MIKLIKKNWTTILIYVTSFLMFSPSIFKFYTNDDFFFLKISGVSSIGGFLNFFNLFKDTAGIGAYRPLTLRFYYFLTTALFNSSPVPLRIISFFFFFADIFLVGKLTELLTKNKKIALVSSFLYAVSATHFGQLYYIGMFQELCITLFFLLSVIFFAQYEIAGNNRLRKIIFSFVFFILALLSKETAVMIPVAFAMVHFYLGVMKKINLSIEKFIAVILPFVLIILAYLFLHFRYFGVLAGDSYVWNFAPNKLANTIVWYGVWSLGIPESFVDFIGPGIHINPNLFLYWSPQVIPILILFALELILLFVMFIKTKKSQKYTVAVFSVLWFLITLLPVAFLPIHKFSYYLTLPLFGISLFISYLLSLQKSAIRYIFCGIWLAISFINLNFTYKTNWITQGEVVAENVYQYFQKNQADLASKKIVFVDTSADDSLPWSPTETVKTAVSGNNFFDVFFPRLSKNISFSGSGEILIKSRQFLGY